MDVMSSVTYRYKQSEWFRKRMCFSVSYSSGVTRLRVGPSSLHNILKSSRRNEVLYCASSFIEYVHK
jgi:hypothetical protein